MSETDAYWLISMSRVTGDTWTELYEGPNAADRAHAEADRLNNAVTYATVVGRR